MNIGSLTIAVNNLTDEDFSSSVLVEFFNDAISKINIEVGANYPYLDVKDGSEYVGFPDKWQRALLIPFAAGRVKQVDSSQFEYSDSYAEFMNNVAQFKTRYPVPAEYKDTNDLDSIVPDYTGNPWGWN